MSDETAFPLGEHTLYHAADLAAKVCGSVMLQTQETLTVEQAAALSVEVAFAIINEVREYRLKDNKAVRRDKN